MLEDISVFAQAQLAEQFRQVGAFSGAVQAAAVATGYRGDAIHVVAAAQVVFCSLKIITGTLSASTIALMSLVK